MKEEPSPLNSSRGNGSEGPRRENPSPSRNEGAIPREAIQADKKMAAAPHAAATILKPTESVQEGSKEDESAKRLARIIVSDIVLYNKKKVDEGIRTNTFFDILKEEIEEGRKHYLSRVSSDLHKTRDYYNEAFDEFIKRRKAASA
jgi:hypothetical protein